MAKSPGASHRESRSKAYKIVTCLKCNRTFKTEIIRGGIPRWRTCVICREVNGKYHDTEFDYKNYGKIF